MRIYKCTKAGPPVSQGLDKGLPSFWHYVTISLTLGVIHFAGGGRSSRIDVQKTRC